MVELSEEEKGRIRAEMTYREAVARELAPPKRGLSRFSAACAHPVIITICGGLLIAGAGAFFQHRFSVEQQTLQQQRLLTDKKFSVLSSFTDQFERDMSLLFNMRHMELKKAKAATSPAAKADWDDVKDRYWKMAEEHWKKHREVGGLLEVRALFTSPDVHEAADKLEKKAQLLSSGKLSEKQIDQLGEETRDGLRDIALKMAKEIKQAR